MDDTGQGELSKNKVCPECGQIFQGNGWEGIDAHWRSKHELIMPYEKAWSLIRSGRYEKGKSAADANKSDLASANRQRAAGSDQRVSVSSKPKKQPPIGTGVAERPIVPLYGVDFSGAKEKGGRNRKCWIAGWHPDRPDVWLKCGGDTLGFGRYELTNRILRSGGWWVIDFPFGPPAAVARAAGWSNWQEYLAWCCSKCDPKELRDELRTKLASKSVHWSTKRRVDVMRRATWFPFFQMLFRQTIMGARDVLATLDAVNRDEVTVLPFHDYHEPTHERSVVVEGFPGWTLKKVLCQPHRGYKGSSVNARDRRAAIVNALCKSGVPISDTDCTRAIRDREGDAVDALVLVYAAWCGQRRSPQDWIESIAPKDCEPYWSMEGWYFD